jgi:hypothetical protein
MRMRRILLVIVGIVLGVGGIETRLAAQMSSSVSFEVASIRVRNSGAGSTTMRVQPGRYSAANVTLRTLIVNAYDLQGFQLSGGPSWIRSEHFDIVAKIPGDISLSIGRVAGCPAYPSAIDGEGTAR